MTVKGEIIKDHLGTYPTTPSLTLAKLIYQNYPTAFMGIEDARKTICYYRGKNGKKDLANLKDKSFVVPEGKANPFDSLPEGMRHFDDWEPYHIEGKKTLVIADLHMPFHEKKPIMTALTYSQKQDIDTILILGDLGDFYTVSWWEKNPLLRDFEEERQIIVGFLRLLRDAFPKAEIVYKIGNHEERHERFVKVKAPQWYGMPFLSYESIFESEKHGIQIVKDKRIIKIASLNCVHGHEFGRTISSPVNPARGLYMRGKSHAVCGHFHQSSEHTETSMTGKVISCFSIGCLCSLHPDWLPINKWNWGFGIIEQDGDDYRVYNKKIIDGKIY